MNLLGGKIETKDDATKIVRQAFLVFFLLSIFLLFTALILTPSEILLIPAIFFALTSIILRRKMSRAVAFLYVILFGALATLVLFLQTKSHFDPSGLMILISLSLLLHLSFRSFIATRIHYKFRSS